MADEQTTKTAEQKDQEQKQQSPNGHKKDENKDEHKEEPKKPHPIRKAIIIIAVAIVAIGGILFWLHSRHFESTDDAYIDGHISGIASRIAGTITAVYLEENQSVKAGEVLVDLDPRDNKVALEQARSQLAQAQEQTQAQQPNVPVTAVTNQTQISTTSSEVSSAEAGLAAAERDYEAAVAKIDEAEANNTKAQADVARYRPLADKDEVPREQFDQVVANAKSLAATVVASRKAADSARKQVDQRQAQLNEARRRAEEARQNAPRQVAIQRANVLTRQSAAEAARAQVDQAELNLSYCKITSPVDGIVAKRTAEIGQHVTPGQQVMLVTQLNDLWVTANFRETQLRRMHPGQSVRVHVDAINGDFDAYLESMPGATGSVVSLLPPENATGNFVKVVQRLPVRIRLKKNQGGLERLRPGMSVEPKVRVD
ncbi:MAG TPA: HlyD family secretion protein [Bryobacteraceae bacterium]|nr:HlyD family secretion protein [Bryobacteraceae bacterium]